MTRRLDVVAFRSTVKTRFPMSCKWQWIEAWLELRIH